MLTPILMAGGSGTRLWPLSRRRAPKQVAPLLDGETMLKKTAARLVRAFGARSQSTLIAFRGRRENARSVGDTDVESIARLLQSTAK